jgi:shikimate dehydrogenase
MNTAVVSPDVIAGPAIRGSTELMLVVADPVAQVKAPELFNAVFARFGVDAAVVPAQVPANRLAAFAEHALALGNVRGLLVSIPHKTALATCLARLDAVAEAAGAVNAVRRAADGQLEGAMFDGAGFVGALRHHGIDATGRRALLVGAGGAGLAIASALAGSGLSSLAVFDAAPARAGQLVDRLAAMSGHPLQVAAEADPAGFDLVIHATPLGLRPGDPLPVDPFRIERGSAVIDILMTREPTPLVAACRARGLHAETGHEMLIQQVPAYLDFFGYASLADTLRRDGGSAMQELRRSIGA